MDNDERWAWQQLVFEANRLGRDGKRVIAADILPPDSATGSYMKLLHTDNGPHTATEKWKVT